MSITVAAFYADQPGRPSRLLEFLPYVLASRRALALTNPDARYVVLTDSATVRLFEPYEIECAAVAPLDMPLMLKIIYAQRAFTAAAQGDLLVLPDVDCLANRAIADATPRDCGLAITHKGPKFHYMVNNLALVRDFDLATWFLDRAFGILEGWPSDKQLWGGDQEAWQSALGRKMPGDIGYWAIAERLAGEILLARPEGKPVHIYPCATHNCPLSDDGSIRKAQQSAYFVHFKGPRKMFIDRWMTERFGP